ncbi:MAG: helix-turn-helix domain-containing protein [Flavobacteriales bacterium]|nr:helix-turn-helix domain-containing protein [Flavobacteriales bacterium]
MDFKDRLKQARTQKGLSQSKLAKEIGMHVTNISRYERGENKPTSQALTKLGDVLGVSADYLMNGSTEDMANNSISDKELLLQFKKVEHLSNDKKRIVKELLDAFLLKDSIKQQMIL